MKPTPEQLEQSVNVICKVIGQLPCYHVYEEFVAPRFNITPEDRSLQAMMHNAALDSTLINLRCLNEFFHPDGQSDDIRSHHFPNVSLTSFLSPLEAQAINKYLAHLTTVRLDIADKPWEIDELVQAGLERGIKFLQLIEAGFPNLKEATATELLGALEILPRIQRRIAKRQNRREA